MPRSAPFQLRTPGDAPPAVLRAPFGAEARAALRRALAGGALMSYPTETSYALGGNARDAALVAAVYRLKGRPPDKPLLLLVDGSAGVGDLVAAVPRAAERLMARFWPGPLTLVFRAGAGLPRHLAVADGTVALRWSPHPVLRTLLRLAGGAPLVGTSANRSGEPAAATLDAVLAALPRGIALAVDGGPCPAALPSTVLDVTASPPRLLRPGAVSAAALAAALGQA